MRRLTPTALLAAIVLAAACNGATAPVDDDYMALPADQVVYGVEYITTDNGVRRATLKADTALVYNDSALMNLQVVHLELYNDNGTHQATLTSASGELNRNTNKMVARGSVVLVVHGEQGRTVWTEELHYDPNQKRIWSDVHTRSRDARGADLTGDGFTSDDQFTNFRIQGLAGTGLRFDF
jgi:LPS export ABC transporter protein LptC